MSNFYQNSIIQTKSEDKMAVRKDIKVLLANEDITLTELARRLSLKTGKNIAMKSLSQKLSNETLKYDEVKLIAEVLGYKVKFEKEDEFFQ
jgi:hypothetical protein